MMTMYLLKILLLLSNWIFIINGTQVETRIIGDEKTTIENHPYQVSIDLCFFVFFCSFECGGSIISNYYVITAAHCIFSTPENMVYIRAGSNTTSEDGQVIKVQKSYTHPSYFNRSSLDNDIAILKLSSPIKFGETAKPITLPSYDYKTDAGEFMTVTGWGQLAEDGILAKILRKAQIPLISNEKCQQAYEKIHINITERMLCAGTETGDVDACKGDSGGPAVIDNVLVGIVGFGKGCGRPEYPGVYIRVTMFRDFVKNITQL